MHGENSRSRRDGFRLFCVAAILAVAARALTACDDAERRRAGRHLRVRRPRRLVHRHRAAEGRGRLQAVHAELPAPGGRRQPRHDAVRRELRGRIHADMLGSQDVPRVRAAPPVRRAGRGHRPGHREPRRQRLRRLLGLPLPLRAARRAARPQRPPLPDRQRRPDRDARWTRSAPTSPRCSSEAAQRAPEARVHLRRLPAAAARQRHLPEAGPGRRRRRRLRPGDARSCWSSAQKAAAKDAGAEYVDVYTHS